MTWVGKFQTYICIKFCWEIVNLAIAKLQTSNARFRQRKCKTGSIKIFCQALICTIFKRASFDIWKCKLQNLLNCSLTDTTLSQQILSSIFFRFQIQQLHHLITTLKHTNIPLRWMSKFTCAFLLWLLSVMEMMGSRGLFHSLT